MPCHEEHLKYDNSKSEIIVVWSSYNSLIAFEVLKLWGLVCRCSDFAEPPRSVDCDLIRITVDQTHCGSITNEKIPVIDISNNLAAFVD